MDRTWKWKVTGVLMLLGLAVCILLPTFASTNPETGEPDLPTWFTQTFKRKLVLGLDLRGGIHLQYRVDAKEALARRTASAAGQLEAALKAQEGVTAKVTPGNAETFDSATSMVASFASAEDAGKLDVAFVRKHAPAYDIAGKVGNDVTLTLPSDATATIRREALERAIETIERRINEFGVSESSVTRRGEDEIVVQMPGIKESEFAAAKEKLAQTGQLRFQIVDQEGWSDFYQKVRAREPSAQTWPADLPQRLKEHKISTVAGVRSTSRELLEYMVKGNVDDDHIVGIHEFWTSPKDSTLEPIESMTAEQEKNLSRTKYDPAAPIVKGYQLYYLLRKTGMSGENVEQASVGYDQYNRAEVNMQFSKTDENTFYEMTKANVNKQMAIMIDDVVFSAPNIKEPIPGGRVRIELGRSFGGQAQKEAAALVAVLKSGALQAPLRKLHDSQVGPTLGADSVESGKMAVLIGFSGVLLFMAFYYRVAGLIACVALACNVVFMLAMMTALGAAMTLPGIAGVVLTIGTAVDANVLSYERIRDELRSGTPVRQAIDQGYDDSFSSIFDGNMTMVIAGIVLYQYGTGPVRGFAVTTVVGTIVSMFTALVISRLFFAWIYGRGAEPAKMSI